MESYALITFSPSLFFLGPALMPRGLKRCHWLLAVSAHWGSALISEWSKALPLTADCLSPLRAFPDGRVVLGIAADC